jgi:hypothetical protein
MNDTEWTDILHGSFMGPYWMLILYNSVWLILKFSGSTAALMQYSINYVQ